MGARSGVFAVLDWWIVGEALLTVPVNMQTLTGLTLLQLVRDGRVVMTINIEGT